MYFLLSSLIGFFITVSCIRLLHPLAIRLNLVDIPGGRKAHQGNIPLIGGVAMFCGFSFALLTLHISLQEYRSLLAACLVLVFVGLLDDLHELTPRHKFIAQIVAVLLIAIWGGVELHSLGNLFFLGNVQLSYLALPMTVFAIVGIINAVNMLDGVDGLAGSLALVQFTLLSYIAMTAQRYLDVEILLLAIAIIIGFLCFNFPAWFHRKHKIFMGDAGSLFLGLMLGWFTIRLSQGTVPVAQPVTMLWIMAVPLIDSISAIVRRLRKGRSPFHPDRAHLHDILRRAGCSNFQIVFIICMLSFLLGVFGIVTERLAIQEGWRFLCFLLLLSGFLYAMRHAWYFMKRIKNIL